MAKKVVISGLWSSDDKKYIEHSEDLEIIHYSQMGPLQQKDWPLFLHDARKADLVIFGLFGNNLDAYFRIPELHYFFREPLIRKVMWTQDAQHEWGMGLPYQRFFRRYYLNHSRSLDKYDEVKPYWLPSCFCSLGIDELINLLSDPVEIKKDIIFPYIKYDLDDRPIIASRIEQKVSQRGLISYFGYIDYGIPYLRAVQGSRICLNISTLGSLNIRNFEVWGVDRVSLAEKVVDHDKINVDLTHTYFFDRDLSNFDEALEKALNDASQDIHTSRDVINQHMLVHRYVEIINNELATNYRVMRVGMP
jgi:hypothetical protein